MKKAVQWLLSRQNEFWLQKLHHYLALKRSNKTALSAVNRIREIIESLRQQVQEPEQYFAEAFDLAENVEGILRLLQNQLQSDVAITLDMPERALVIHGNASRIGQVWTNLIVNSLQAMQGDARHLLVRVERWTGSVVRVVIRDNGHGIRKEDQPHVFDNKFSTRHHDTGLGLGLFLSRKIVEEHKGQLTFITGTGYTEMHVFLPI